MPIPLYMDEHVHRAITTGLRLRGVDVLTVQEDGFSGAPDPTVMNRATELGRVVFSQDEDFLVEAARRQRGGAPFSGLLFGHLLDLTVGDAVRDLEIFAQVSEAVDLRNKVEFLPL